MYYTDLICNVGAVASCIFWAVVKMGTIWTQWPGNQRFLPNCIKILLNLIRNVSLITPTVMKLRIILPKSIPALAPNLRSFFHEADGFFRTAAHMLYKAWYWALVICSRNNVWSRFEEAVNIAQLLIIKIIKKILKLVVHWKIASPPHSFLDGLRVGFY
jgi:hypothetical protein